MTILRARRRRPARSRRTAAVLVAAGLVLVTAGVLEYFAGPVTVALAAGLIAGYSAGRMAGGPRSRRRRRP